MKRIVTALLCTLSFSCYAIDASQTQAQYLSATHHACPQATATTDPSFCASFRSAAQCHCTSSGLPSGVCQNIQTIYSRMISIFGSIQRACEYQRDTSVKTCIDDWNCFRFGGKDSNGGLCSASGRACQ